VPTFGHFIFIISEFLKAESYFLKEKLELTAEITVSKLIDFIV
jgi:hypothetical protein